MSFAEKSYYRVDEVARYFGISRTTEFRLIKRAQLRAVRIRSCLRVNRRELDRFARKNAKKPKRIVQ